MFPKLTLNEKYHFSGADGVILESGYGFCITGRWFPKEREQKQLGLPVESPHSVFLETSLAFALRDWVPEQLWCARATVTHQSHCSHSLVPTQVGSEPEVHRKGPQEILFVSGLDTPCLLLA